MHWMPAYADRTHIATRVFDRIATDHASPQYTQIAFDSAFKHMQGGGGGKRRNSDLRVLASQKLATEKL